MIDILIKNGATIKAVDEARNTPLHFAALSGWDFHSEVQWKIEEEFIFEMNFSVLLSI